MTSNINWSEWWALQQSKTTVLVVLAVIGMAVLSKWMGTAGQEPQYSKKFIRQMKRLVQQASKWHTTARQDSDPTTRLVHANYALAYANVARALASDNSIEQITGINITELLYFLEDDQKKALQLMVHHCPQLKPTGVYTSGNAWM
jgi:hypothetical protein